MFVFFSDASEQGYGACAYIRYAMLNGCFESRLIMAKTRLAPTKKISIVRLELSGALLAARMKSALEKEMRIVAQEYYCLVDSQIVQAMIQKDSYGFRTFAALRIGEIQDHTERENWFWLQGNLNIADILTRGVGLLGSEAIDEWKHGPRFLTLPEDQWPLESKIQDLELPEEIEPSFCMLATNAVVTLTEEAISVERFSSYLKLLRTTARILRVAKERSLKEALREPDAADLEDAKLWWVKVAQKDIFGEVQNGKFERLGVFNDCTGTIFVGERVTRKNQMSAEGSPLALLPYRHHFSRLYAQYIHNLTHSGVVTTMAKVRLSFWIVGLRRMVKSIVVNCVPCRERRAKLASQ